MSRSEVGVGKGLSHAGGERSLLGGLGASPGRVRIDFVIDMASAWRSGRLCGVLSLQCGVMAVVLCVGAVAARGQTTGEKGGPPVEAPASGTSLTQLRQMVERGHAREALEQLDREAAASRVLPGMTRLRGIALYAVGNMREAERAFAKAMAEDPGDKEAAQMRGITLYRLGRPAEAIPLLESSRGGAARTGGQDQGTQGADGSNAPVDPQYVLALCYLDTRRYDDARHAFAAQYGFAPDSAPAYLLGARMLLRREYIPVAREFARKALELSPQLPLAHLLLGETALAGEHLDEAIEQFQQERAINPLYPSTYDRLGDAYIRRGEYANARQYLQEAVLLEPNFTGPFILLGKVLLKQQDPASASAYLEHARRMDDQNYMTHSLLGQAYRQMGRLDDARRETETAAKIQAATAPKLTDVQ